ncbi:MULTISPECIES: uracil phosphoribosyltransferase [unclassified Porphyromonas]|uniref:uracil phosphoribosyltransferase n=1 Tax=unclassified Porphyromonas TaxID=2645799 RepID=UPI00052C5F49|nr:MULTISPECIES: uracil phosphoribosyltransferase [unclassified Porphyromonas]KGN83897.1 uracil phosphoribosyltransferase [Porphyromonas sp. COT-290 OH860]KGO01524.1 uracil phosphoribosyltransferase [Porphyromonas sp. COT-290 OH3588]
MQVRHLIEEHSLLSRFVAEMRDVEIQHDPLRFRRNIERVGEIMAYEISKKLNYSLRPVRTPLGVAECAFIEDQIVLGTILRAGLSFHQGFLSYFDRAENAFVSAYRKHKDRLNFDIFIEYIASPSLEGKTLILVDPMLATGSSMELAFRALLTKGTPTEIHLVSIIASQEAVDYLQSKFPEANVHLWVAAIDPKLNEMAYIVPGLGDAGDLAYGEKL